MADDLPPGPGPGATPAGAPSAPPFPRDSAEFDRIINITDGVTAIAITLLVLQLNLPNPAVTPDQHLTTIFHDLGAPFLAFALSFAIVAFAWYGHHRFIAQLLGLDGVMVVWNFLFLFVLVLTPFAADLVGLYSNSNEAAALYALTMGTLFILDLPGNWLAHRRGLIARSFTPRQWRLKLLDTAVPGAMFLLSVPVAYAAGIGTASWIWFATWPIAAVAGHTLGKADGEAAG